MGYVILFVIGAPLWAGFAAIVARNKGNSGFTAGIVGLFLGPLGLLLAVLDRRNQAALDRREVEGGTSKRCPFCAEVIRRDAQVCRFCTRDLPPVSAPVYGDLVARSQAYLAANPEPYKKEWLRRELIREGSDPQSVEAAIVDAASRLVPEATLAAPPSALVASGSAVRGTGDLRATMMRYWPVAYVLLGILVVVVVVQLASR